MSQKKDQYPSSSTPKFTSTLSAEDAVEQARLLKALADPMRLRILPLLSQHECRVVEIVKNFTLEQPTISHQLKVLCDAGLVYCRKKARYAYYYVNREKLAEAGAIIEGIA